MYLVCPLCAYNRPRASKQGPEWDGVWPWASTFLGFVRPGVFLHVPQHGHPRAWDYVWDAAIVIVALLAFIGGTYLMGWMHGWWIGHNHVLRLRHVRSDRIQARLNDKVAENLDLQDQVERLVAQIPRSTLPAGPITADRDIQRLQAQLRNMEASFWQKDQQVRELDRRRMGLIRQIGRLSALFVEAKDVVGRARAEVHNHAHNHCVISRQIYIAPRGRVWHFDNQCAQLSRSAVIELFACERCASFYITPYLSKEV